MTGSTAPPVGARPLPAATVVLLRESGEGRLETYLLQRSSRMSFMAGMYVFPGGKLAKEDASPAVLARVEDPGAHRDLWVPQLKAEASTALAVAAIRETFEETGVLLTESGHTAVPTQPSARGRRFADLLVAYDLRLRLSRLTPLSRWVTPAMEPRRYDTCFYLAACEEQHAEPDREEAVAGCWLTPDEALQRFARGTLRLPPPTHRTLAALQPHRSVAAAVEAAASRPPPLIEPILRRAGHDLLVLYPGDPDHPVQENLLGGPTRSVLPRG